MTMESQILFPMSILVPRCCALDTSVSDTNYTKISWIFPARLSRCGVGRCKHLPVHTVTHTLPGVTLLSQGFHLQNPAVIRLQMWTTLTNWHAAAYQHCTLYIEGAGPQMHGTLAKWKLHKYQLSDKVFIMLLLYQSCRKRPCNLLSFSCNGIQVSSAIQAPWLALIYAVTKPKGTSKQGYGRQATV